MYYAHTGSNYEDWEPLKDHLLNVAQLARLFASAFEAGDEAFIAGLLHDLGKYGDRFQDRLHGTASHIDHWTPGAWVALGHYGGLKGTGRWLALTAQAHHVGLQQDYKDFLKKIGAKDPSPGTTLSADNMKELLHRFAADGLEFPQLTSSDFVRSKKYCSDMLDVRMLFSALVDADFLETEKFFNTVEHKPQRPTAPAFDAKEALERLKDFVNALQGGTAPRNVVELRNTLFSQCLCAGKRPQSLFTLSAPTGSGKTLAMLAFALRHAVEHSLERVIVVLPFLNVIEQTARVYRDVFKGFPDGYVIEHHSLARSQSHDGDDDGRERLMTENWDAPVVITTSVQFLESLFSNRPSACRKLHNIARSVVLFDEVQTLPSRLAIHTLAALSRLRERYHVSVVFATATQPAFTGLHDRVCDWCHAGWRPHSILERDVEDHLFKNARRVRYDWLKGKLSWEALAQKISTIPQKQVLCVLNTKKQALHMTRRLQEKFNGEVENAVFHFSTNMCAAHRSARLEDIKKHLKAELPCYLISTQCIEAGVDISFPEAFRAWAPLEAIIQTAGRCNRNNELSPELGTCRVFTPEEEFFPTPEYKNTAAIARAFISDLDESESLYLDAPETIERYFNKVRSLLKREESAKKYKELCKALTCADFVDVAHLYHLIEQNVITVVVPYGKGKELIGEALKHGINAGWMRRAQSYSVSVRRPDSDAPIRGVIEPAPIFKRGERFDSEDWFLCTTHAKYDDLTGLEVPDALDLQI